MKEEEKIKEEIVKFFLPYDLMSFLKAIAEEMIKECAKEQIKFELRKVDFK